MPGVGKVPFCHDRHNQLPIRQRVYHRLRVIRGNALPGQAVGFGCCRDQAVVRAVPFAAVSIRYGPFAEFYRVVGRPVRVDVTIAIAVGPHPASPIVPDVPYMVSAHRSSSWL